MKEITVLGPGCSNCKVTAALIETIAREKGVPIHLTKVEDIKEIMSYGIMSTPGVVLEKKVVHAGGVPSRAKIEAWLA
jgi:small redox-active disulfide protein 2